MGKAREEDKICLLVHLKLRPPNSKKGQWWDGWHYRLCKPWKRAQVELSCCAASWPLQLSPAFSSSEVPQIFLRISSLAFPQAFLRCSLDIPLTFLKRSGPSLEASAAGRFSSSPEPPKKKNTAHTLFLHDCRNYHLRFWGFTAEWTNPASFLNL